MWKARRDERRRSSSVGEDGSVEADDISPSRTGRSPMQQRHARDSHSSDEEESVADHDDGLNNDPPVPPPPSSHGDRVPDSNNSSSNSTHGNSKRKPFFSRSLFNTSTSPSSSHHIHPHPPNLAPTMASAFVSKSRRVRFDLALRIHDLNNVPLVSGTSFVKWHLPSSTAAEHRGRTPKAAIKDHRVVFSYEKTTTVRLTVGKAGMLQECWIHLEVLQEYSAGGRGERITLGHIRLNLAEYVEASEASAAAGGGGGGGPLLSPTISTTTTTPTGANAPGSSGAAPAAGGVTTAESTAPPLDEGVTRRYLMQDSKINSTLKIGVYMRHAEGTRDYVAPPLRTAPVFGGIAGIISNSEPAAMQSTTGLNGKLDGLGGGGGGFAGGGGGDANGGGAEGGVDGSASTPNLSSRNREAGELQDMYRRTLAAHWASQPGELKADECVEDIFAGGDGWGKGGRPHHAGPSSVSGGGGPGGASAPSVEGEMTARADGSGGGPRMGRGMMSMHKRNMSRQRGKVRPHRKVAGELDEMDVRDDLVGWRVSEQTYS